MSEQDTKKTIKKEDVSTTKDNGAKRELPSEQKPIPRGARVSRPVASEKSSGERPKRDFKKNRRSSSKRRERTKPEFDQKMLAIRRVTRVSSGGRRFSFSVAMAIGDKKGKVGVGIGKAGDTTLAIEKAIRNGKKNIIEVKRTKNNSISHEIDAKYN